MKMSTKTNSFDLLQARFKIKFKNVSLLQNAFIHRSYLNEHRNFKSQSNERLEFLGDAVLSLIVSNHLYRKLPNSPEGKLTQQRASLVRTETLAKLASSLSLGQYLYISKGEEESGGRSNITILANTFEALIGAIYLDQGIATTRQFVEEIMLVNWKDLVETAITDDKSKLQEILQRDYHQSPKYKLLKSWGPDHDRRFEIAVYQEDNLLGKGAGKNKQIAAQRAAKDALSRLKARNLG